MIISKKRQTEIQNHHYTKGFFKGVQSGIHEEKNISIVFLRNINDMLGDIRIIDENVVKINHVIHLIEDKIKEMQDDRKNN